MKIFAAITIIVCSVLTGLELFNRKKRACMLLSNVAGFCLYMQSCVRYEQAVPEEMTLAFPSDDLLFQYCRSELERGRDFADAWNESVNKYAGRLKQEEFELILRLGNELGRTDVNGELMRLEHIYSLLDELYRRRNGELENDRRLCLSFSLLAGIFTTLMII